MTTCVVVRKGESVAIAADSLTTFGDTCLPRALDQSSKLFRIGASQIGLCGSSAHFFAVRRGLEMLGANCRLGSTDQVFETFCCLHRVLKAHFFLNAKEEEFDPYESSQMTALIANASGIYGVYSYREIFSFQRYWAIGTGHMFALGAMHALYDLPDMDAASIAVGGVDAGVILDRNSGSPVDLTVQRLAPVASPDLDSMGVRRWFRRHSWVR